MDNEKKPLIQFSPRPQDNGRTIGGGDSNTVPKWVLTDSELVERSKQLVANIDQITDEWDDTSIEGLPHVLKATSIEKAKANTHQRKIVSMFTKGQKTAQIGFIGEHSLMLRVDSKAQLQIIRNNFLDYNKNACPISSLTDIELFKPQITESNGNSKYKLIPLTYDDPSTDQLAIQVIQSQLNKHGITNELVAYTDRLQMIKIPQITTDSLKFIRTLPIRAGEPVEKVVSPFRFISNLSVDDFPTQEFNPEKKYPIIN